MSVENGKVCCNCRHCKRIQKEHGTIIECRCDRDNAYLTYATVLGHWCRHWAKERGDKMTFERFYRDFVVIFGRFLAVLMSKGVITKKDADFITCQISEDEWRENETGEWIEIEGGCYICSNCEDIEAYTPNFCPNCGAKMKGDTE